MRPATLFLATTALLAAPTFAQTAPSRSAMPAPTATPLPSQNRDGTPASAATPTPSPTGTATPAQSPATAPTAATTVAPTAAATIAAMLPGMANVATFNRLVAAADLGALLAGPGPYTVFAPNETSYSRLPAGTLDTLTAPSNKAGLQTIVRTHVVAGALTDAQIRQQIAAGGGRATLTTLSGQPLVATLESNVVLITDPIGNKSFINKADTKATNGVIHAMNGIILPKLG